MRARRRRPERPLRRPTPDVAGWRRPGTCGRRRRIAPYPFPPPFAPPVSSFHNRSMMSSPKRSYQYFWESLFRARYSRSLGATSNTGSKGLRTSSGRTVSRNPALNSYALFASAFQRSRWSSKSLIKLTSCNACSFVASSAMESPSHSLNGGEDTDREDQPELHEEEPDRPVVDAVALSVREPDDS